MHHLRATVAPIITRVSVKKHVRHVTGRQPLGFGHHMGCNRRVTLPPLVQPAAQPPLTASATTTAAEMEQRSLWRTGRVLKNSLSNRAGLQALRPAHPPAPCRC